VPGDYFTVEYLGSLTQDVITGPETWFQIECR